MAPAWRLSWRRQAVAADHEGLERPCRTSRVDGQAKIDRASSSPWRGSRRSGTACRSPTSRRGDRLVFIDETWASTHMTRRYGRATRTAAGCGGPIWTPEDIDVSGRLAHQRPHRPAGGRRSHERRHLQSQCRADLTISQAIRSLAYAKQLRPVVRASFICRPTTPISIRSSKPSPSLRHCCERSPPGPSPRYEMPSASAIASPRRNAPTISPTLDMFHSIGIGSSSLLKNLARANVW
jgi:hypothetical protein